MITPKMQMPLDANSPPLSTYRGNHINFPSSVPIIHSSLKPAGLHMPNEGRGLARPSSNSVSHIHTPSTCIHLQEKKRQQAQAAEKVPISRRDCG